jgi:hypothetical protein
MSDLTIELTKARDLAKNAMDSAFACAQAFEDLFLAANQLLEQHETIESDVGGVSTQAEPYKTFDPEAPPNLTHTELIYAEVDGEAVKDKWRLAFEAVVSRAARVKRSSDERRKLFSKFKEIKWEPGNREGEKGYKYLPDVDISLQGRETNKVWKGMLGIAKEIGFPIEAVFRWPHKEGVAFPGEIGHLGFKPRADISIDLEKL